VLRVVLVACRVLCLPPSLRTAGRWRLLIFTGGALAALCSSTYTPDLTPETDTSSYVIYGQGRPPACQGRAESCSQPFADAGTDTEMGSTLGSAAVMGSPGQPGCQQYHLVAAGPGRGPAKPCQAATAKMAAAGSATTSTASRSNSSACCRFDMMLDEDRGVLLGRSRGWTSRVAPSDMPLMSIHIECIGIGVPGRNCQHHGTASR